MKNLPRFALIFTLLFASCIKAYIPIPHPPAPPAPTTPIGVSAVVNGTYTTFNNRLNVDTSNGDFYVTGWGDSAGFTNAQIVFIVEAYNTPIIPGNYTYQPNGTPYSSAITIYFDGSYNTQLGFTSYDDTVKLTSVTDTTFAGTIVGTLHGEITNPNYPFNRYDSVMPFTNAQFYLRRY